MIVLIAERSGRFCAFHWPGDVCEDGLDGRAAAGHACKPLRGGVACPGVATFGGRDVRSFWRSRPCFWLLQVVRSMLFGRVFCAAKRVHPRKRFGVHKEFIVFFVDVATFKSQKEGRDVRKVNGHFAKSAHTKWGEGPETSDT